MATSIAPVQTRSERPTSFEPADFDIPTGLEVNWKHTPVRRLAALFADEPGDDGAVTIDLESVEALLTPAEDVVVDVFRPEDRVAAVAFSRAPGRLTVQVPEGEQVAETITIPIVGSDAASRGFGHIVIEALPGSRATIILEHTGSAQYAQDVEILVRENAHLTVVSVQDWDDDAVHLASHQARVEDAGFLRHFVITFGGSIVRVNPSVELAGDGAEGELYGLAFADDGQHFESQVYLHHKGPRTRGDVLYKGALQGTTARTVWIGDVLIGAAATGTDSYEANRNLILTTGARADSIPNLEIETGDIAGAGHASATGRFDDEQLFYLQARGIPEEEARRLVVLGFLAEIIQRIDDAPLQARLHAAVEAELARGAAA